MRLPEHRWEMTEPITVHPGRPLPVPGVHGSALEVAVTLRPAEDATAAASVYLMSDEPNARPFGGGDETADDCCGVAITISWQEATLKASRCQPHRRMAALHSRLHASSAVFRTECTPRSWYRWHRLSAFSFHFVVQVSWQQSIDSDGIAIDLASARREVGGPVTVTRNAPVQLRVFLDHSALEARFQPGPVTFVRALCTAAACIQQTTSE